MEAGIVQRIRADLTLNSELDFTVLLGIAEKLSPGIYVAMAGAPLVFCCFQLGFLTHFTGDPKAIEEKFVELFESF